jgi:hypothetical protein
MTNLIRSIETPCTNPDADNDAGGGRGDAERLREWIVTNGLGGYASGTVCGVPTRRYHGLLVAALPAPLGRTMMFNHLNECLVGAGGESLGLEIQPLAGRRGRPGAGSLRSASRRASPSGGSRPGASPWRSG